RSGPSGRWAWGSSRRASWSSSSSRARAARADRRAPLAQIGSEFDAGPTRGSFRADRVGERVHERIAVVAAARRRVVLAATVVVDADGDHRRVDEVGLDVYGGSFWLDGMFDGVDER